MSRIIVDASVALAWCFADEQSSYARMVLENLESGDAIVPQFFWIEMANALLIAERRGRIKPEESEQFIQSLAQLQIETDAGPDPGVVSQVRALARQHELTVYDAVYLHLAIREELPLATLDDAILRSAKSVGVAIFESA